jgi:hypothetical protein
LARRHACHAVGLDAGEDVAVTRDSRAGQRTPTCWYVVPQDITDRGLAQHACLAVLDAVRSKVARVHIDAYSDYRDSLTPQAQAAQDELRARGANRRRGDPGMGVELDPASAADWDLLRAYATWSIHVELEGAEGTLAVLHDCGQSVGAELTHAEADQLNRSLAGGLRVEALDQLRAREKADRRRHR